MFEPEHIREVIYERNFELELRELFSDAREGMEFIEGAEYLIARDPKLGVRADGDWLWVMKLAPVNDRDVYLYYSFDEHHVWVVSILAA